MKYFNNLKEVYDDLKEKLSFNQSLLEVERIILLMEKTTNFILLNHLLVN